MVNQNEERSNTDYEILKGSPQEIRKNLSTKLVGAEYLFLVLSNDGDLHVAVDGSEKDLISSLCFLTRENKQFRQIIAMALFLAENFEKIKSQMATKATELKKTVETKEKE